MAETRYYKPGSPDIYVGINTANPNYQAEVSRLAGMGWSTSPTGAPSAPKTPDGGGTTVPRTQTTSTAPATSTQSPTSNTLYGYYSGQGKTLPSVQERGTLYQSLGLGASGAYTGSADQNAALLRALQTQGTTAPQGTAPAPAAPAAPMAPKAVTIGTINYSTNPADYAKDTFGNIVYKPAGNKYVTEAEGKILFPAGLNASQITQIIPQVNVPGAVGYKPPVPGGENKTVSRQVTLSTGEVVTAPPEDPTATAKYYRFGGNIYRVDNNQPISERELVTSGANADLMKRYLPPEVAKTIRYSNGVLTWTETLADGTTKQMSARANLTPDQQETVDAIMKYSKAKTAEGLPELTAKDFEELKKTTGLDLGTISDFAGYLAGNVAAVLGNYNENKDDATTSDDYATSTDARKQKEINDVKKLFTVKYDPQGEWQRIMDNTGLSGINAQIRNLKSARAEVEGVFQKAIDDTRNNPDFSATLASRRMKFIDDASSRALRTFDTQLAALNEEKLALEKQADIEFQAYTDKVKFDYQQNKDLYDAVQKIEDKYDKLKKEDLTLVANYAELYAGKTWEELSPETQASIISSFSDPDSVATLKDALKNQQKKGLKTQLVTLGNRVYIVTLDEEGNMVSKKDIGPKEASSSGASTNPYIYNWVEETNPITGAKTTRLITAPNPNYPGNAPTTGAPTGGNTDADAFVNGIVSDVNGMKGYTNRQSIINYVVGKYSGQITEGTQAEKTAALTSIVDSALAE